ncbi:lipoprotein HlpB [Mannheimia pernigra]|uniref:Lipoprotein HlpB n=1 Tax=Mannheimia pernigra TaxID=111844 RepID=A0A7D5IVE3_9PAST|nr:lipoprotein HlpB [Mannheimia pernigra]QLB40338.1 lipoprotein HlpB [Mannheimia pernigra]QLB42351.1 lipoprotein HlpB [Mannheimia pernigra]
MNKFTKISATALVALFLAACDKPSQNSASVTTSTTETTQVATPSEAAKADYQKLIAWNAEQDNTMKSAQAELQQKLATQDPKQMQEGLNEFNKKVEDTIKSLEKVEVSDAQLKQFKEKTKSVLTLSSEVINEQVKVISNPNDEAAKQAAEQKTQTLIEAGNELQKLNVELEKRFTAK